MFDEQRPDIAVIIAAWNAQDTLGRAVESVLAQSGVSFEIIVVDDASTDETLACGQAYADFDRRVTIMSQPCNEGPAAARNRALDSVTARYVTPLDSDDFMDAGRLERLLIIATEGGWDFVCDDLFKVEETSIDGPRKRLWSQTNIGIVPIEFADFLRGNLSALHGGRSELGFVKPLIKKEFIDEYALRYREDMRLGEDYAFYATALAKGARFCLTDPAGYVAVIRPTSLSGSHSARDLGALVQADRMLMKQAQLCSIDRKALDAHYIETMKKWHWMRLIDAVKERDVLSALRCFVAPPAVVLSLVLNLGEQAFLRSGAWLSLKNSNTSKRGRS